jgi:hypothetical protein
MECVPENKEFLHLVSTGRTSQYQSLIATASRAQLDVICGVIKNVIKGRIYVKEEILKAASAFKGVLEKIAQRCFKPSRKKLLLKYGKIIKRVLAAALPIILAACSFTAQAISMTQ